MSHDDPGTLFTLYTFGDSILDCQWYNEAGIDPGRLLVRNDDELLPEFQGQDLTLSRVGPFSAVPKRSLFVE